MAGSFEKGNSLGRKFSSENQPSGKRKSEGKRAAQVARDSMAALLGGVEPDDKAAAAVMTVLPKKKRNKVTTQDVINLRQIMEAKKGNVKAYANVMNVIGAFREEHVISTDSGDGMRFELHFASREGMENTEKILNGE